MNKLLRVLQIFFITAILLSPVFALACIWDADTLDNEKKKKPEIAEIIFGSGKEATDTPRLQKRITELKSDPRENEAAWWNDLAGAYLRLGQPQEAANLLEPIVKKFDSDYGIHANLGTAYHLLGRYQEAEKEIARDLEINPDAHFGLEKYHLALLQYLSRDAEYQKQHVYVDEWSELFLITPAPDLDMVSYQTKAFPEIAKLDLKDTNTLAHLPQWKIDKIGKVSLPPYSLKWDLASDPKFEEGVLYMASLNPKQPACFTMLGIVCLTKRDFNLAAAAFKRAIALGSTQKEILETKISEIEGFIIESQQRAKETKTMVVMGVGILILVLSIIFYLVRRLLSRRAKKV